MGRRHRERHGREERGTWPLVHGFLWNAGAWGIMTFGMNLPRAAVLFWGLAVVFHGAEVGRKLVLARRRAGAGLPQPAGGQAQEPAAQEAQAPASAPADPFLVELEAAVVALGQAAGNKALPGVDLAALRSAGAELHRQRLALLALGAGGARERLVRERDEAAAQAESAGDARTAEVFRAEAESVAGRLAALEQAAGAAARLGARERTLLHQIEALRLSLLQSGVDESRAPDLAGEVERLRLDLRAEAELESDLARARLGGRLGQGA